MNEQVKEYNVDLQRLFVEFLAQDKDLFARVNGIIDPLYFDRELRINVPTITVIPKLSLTSIEFKNKTSRTLESASSPDSSRVVSYLPLGIKGDKGLPMISWGLTWTGLESNRFITKY